MKEVKFIISVAAIMCIASASKANLTDILQKYCVPKDGSNCTGDSRATYNSARNICECNSNLRHYNSGNRNCEDCITGSYASYDYKTCEPIKCPSGYEVKLITNGACPSGYTLQRVTNGGCPNGLVLKSYTVSSKTWN